MFGTGAQAWLRCSVDLAHLASDARLPTFLAPAEIFRWMSINASLPTCHHNNSEGSDWPLYVGTLHIVTTSISKPSVKPAGRRLEQIGLGNGARGDDHTGVLFRTVIGTLSVDEH